MQQQITNMDELMEGNEYLLAINGKKIVAYISNITDQEITFMHPRLLFNENTELGYFRKTHNPFHDEINDFNTEIAIKHKISLKNMKKIAKEPMRQVRSFAVRYVCRTIFVVTSEEFYMDENDEDDIATVIFKGISHSNGYLDVHIYPMVDDAIGKGQTQTCGFTVTGLEGQSTTLCS